MARIPNTRPTSIYWLLDVRPEVLVIWPSGLPFYCGKTVIDVQSRLKNHRYYAASRPRRRLSERLVICGDHVRIKVVEIVPHDADWAECERKWILTLRTLYPNCLNIADGGSGCPGNILSAESRAKISAAHMGKVVSPETRAKMIAARVGKPLSAKHRAQLSESVKRHQRSADHCANLSAALTGKKRPKQSTETRAKRSASLKGRKFSAEHRAKIAEALRGKKRSSEVCAKMSASQMGKKRGPMSDSHRAAISAAHLVRFQRQRDNART